MLSNHIPDVFLSFSWVNLHPKGNFFAITPFDTHTVVPPRLIGFSCQIVSIQIYAPHKAAWSFDFDFVLISFGYCLLAAFVVKASIFSSCFETYHELLKLRPTTLATTLEALEEKLVRYPHSEIASSSSQGSNVVMSLTACPCSK